MQHIIERLMKLTNDTLKKIYPYSTQANRERYLPFLNQYMEEYQITCKPLLIKYKKGCP